MAATIIAGIGLALSLATTYYGISQQKKAERLRKANVRPTYTIAPEIYENKQVAQARAGTGLPDYVKEYYRQGAERGLTTTVDRILKGGGSSADAAPAYSTYLDANGRMALADDERQYKNLQSLMEQNRALGESKDTDWQVNQYGPYADRAQAYAEMYRAGGQYIQSGINTGASTLASYAGSQGQKKDTDQVLGNAGSAGSTGGTGDSPGSAGSAYKSNTGIDYVPNYYSSARTNNMAYNDDLSRRYQTMTPEQQRQVNGFYGNKLNTNLGSQNDQNYFNANNYRSV